MVVGLRPHFLAPRVGKEGFNDLCAQDVKGHDASQCFIGDGIGAGIRLFVYEALGAQFLEVIGRLRGPVAGILGRKNFVGSLR